MDSVLRYEWIAEAQRAMDYLIQVLPYWQQLHPNTEVCHTWTEYVDGIDYVVNLCINTVKNTTGS